VTADARHVVVPPVQFVGEKQVREFAPGVGRPLVVVLGAVEVFEVDDAAGVGAAAVGDDAGVRRRTEQVEEKARERELTEVVDAELLFEPVGRLPARDRHHAGVVAEDIDGAERVGRPRREGPDRREVGQIQLPDRERRARVVGRDVLAGGLGGVDAPAGQHHVGAGAGELAGGLEPDAAVRAGDDHGLSGQVGQVRGGPVGHAGASGAARIRVPGSGNSAPVHHL
jgi:hypothetical protein